MIMVEAGGAVEAATEPPEVAPAGSEEEVSTSPGVLLVEVGSTPGGLPSNWATSTPASPGLSSSIVESAGGECWNGNNGSSKGNGGGVSVTWSSSLPVLVLLVVSSGGGEEEEVVKR